MINEDMLHAEIGILRTIASYPRLIDARDLDACAALFVDNARLEMLGHVFRGIQAIRTWMETLRQSPPGIHLTTNSLIEHIAPGQAAAVSDVVFIRQGDAGWQIVFAGKYIDKFIEAGDRWLFASRIFEMG
jgi:ketosteroid isomerase-like protein